MTYPVDALNAWDRAWVDVSQSSEYRALTEDMQSPEVSVRVESMKHLLFQRSTAERETRRFKALYLQAQSRIRVIEEKYEKCERDLRRAMRIR